MTLKTVDKTWADASHLASVQTTLANGLVALTTYPNWCDSVPGEVDVYDWGAGVHGPLLKRTVLTQNKSYTNRLASACIPSSIATYADSGTTPVALRTNSYDGGNLQQTSTVIGHDYANYPYTSVAGRGNMTAETDCLVASGTCAPGSPATSYTYYDTGQASSMTDPCGNLACADMSRTSHTTTYSYTDSSNSNAFFTQITRPVTSGVAHTESYKYDYPSGNLTTSTDENSFSTTYQYADPFLRLTDVYGPPSPNGPHTHYAYVDGSSPSITTTDPIGVVSQIIQDGFGQSRKTALLSDPQPIYTRTQYDGKGLPFKRWNPTRCDPDSVSSCNETSYGVTQYTYDALGRMKQQTNPDGTESWSFSGNTVTYTNADGNQWARTSDALGRLTEVKEPLSSGSRAPSVKTGYTYDALNNLLTVTQNGDGSYPQRPLRTFSYDSLSRLLAANNPETGATTYTYDGNGNVFSRTDARNIKTSYWYDQLNRLTSKTYAVPTPTPPGYSYTPWPAYVYDKLTIEFGGNPNSVTTATNAVGHMVEAYTTVGASNRMTDRVYTYYDAVGLRNVDILCQSDCRNTGNHPFTEADATYDLAGNVTNISSYGLPTNTTLAVVGTVPYAERNYNYDTAGRLQRVSNDILLYQFPGNTPPTMIGPANVFSATAYSPIGLANANLAVDSTWLNPQMTLTRTYDKRGRVATEVDQNSQHQNIYSFANSYDGPGNVTGFNDSVMGQWGPIMYDNLNRLSSASIASSSYGGVNLAGFGMSWTYDSFGNRIAQNATTGLLPTAWATYSPSNLLTSIPAAAPYDAVGNIIDDGTYKYKYDAENRVCAAYRYKTPISMTQYIYDAMGVRIAKGSMNTFNCDQTTNGFVATSNYITGLSGEQLDEYDGTGSNLVHSNVFAGGRLLATYKASAWTYAFNDWLGTKRAQISADGNLANLSTFGSLPFGDGLFIAGPDVTEQHFTGKERDAESALDYFGARYYASSMGRWMSPDWANKPEDVPLLRSERSSIPQSVRLCEKQSAVSFRQRWP